MSHHDFELNYSLARAISSPADLAALSASDPQRYPFLLQSVAYGTPQSRFDILFAFPGETLVLDRLGEDQDFLRQLDLLYEKEQIAAVDETLELPFKGGWFFYLSYELAQQIEPTLKLPEYDSALPCAFASRVPGAMVWDHQRQQLYLVAERGREELLEAMAADLTSSAPPVSSLQIDRIHEDDPQRYLTAVTRAKEYIVEGDVFQANLSRAWYARVTGDEAAPYGLYQRLCRNNPAPFAGLVHYQNQAIISSSPERLVSVCHGWADTRPIAGTRPRGQGLSQDEAKRRELIGHPKERAEHIMLIDLERNDLGRIAQPGTVEVNELMTLETYAHLHHIVSNVRCKLRPEITPGEVIRAVFPGGTITGCPKVRCMEIIAELEQAGRGPYTGAIGYLNRDGSMDSNILIRTLHLDGEHLTLRAGAGIVADSQPEWELKETRTKARGLLLALGCEVD